MWDVADRHPARTLLLFALSGLIIVDGTRRTVASAATPSRAAPLIAGLILSLGAVPLSMLIRARPEFRAQRTRTLLAVAFLPILLAVGAAALGAKTWLLWAALVLAVALATWWAKDKWAHQPDVTSPDGRASEKQPAGLDTAATSSPPWRHPDSRHYAGLVLGAVAGADGPLASGASTTAVLAFAAGGLVLVGVPCALAFPPWRDPKWGPWVGGAMFLTLSVVALVVAEHIRPR